MTDEHAAHLRVLVRTFHKKITDRYTPVLKQIEAHDKAYPHGGFGVYDDDELERDRNRWSETKGQLLATKSELERAWGLVVDVFGKDACDFAIEEGEQRIGEIPYAD